MHTRRIVMGNASTSSRECAEVSVLPPGPRTMRWYVAAVCTSEKCIAYDLLLKQLPHHPLW